MNLVLLVARLFFGLGLAVHGGQKLFGWFGGHGLAGTAGFFENHLGFHPGRLFALAAGLGELGGGLLVALGLLGPVGPALMVLVMVVAALTVHIKSGFLSSNNGIETPMLYAMGALLLAFAGPGAYSLDGALGLLELSSVGNAALALVAAVVAGAVTSMLRKAPAPVGAAATAAR
ncbi:MAG: DoxX family protein [Anaerolineae bacterium]